MNQALNETAYQAHRRGYEAMARRMAFLHECGSPALLRKSQVAKQTAQRMLYHLQQMYQLTKEKKEHETLANHGRG